LSHHSLDFPASKTDPFRKGVSILIARAPGSSTCAVTALKQLFAANPQPPTAPLFSDPDGSLSPTQFISTLKSRLTSIGLDPSLYSGHSFRSGVAAAVALLTTEYSFSVAGEATLTDVPWDRVLGLSACLHVTSLMAQAPEPPSLPFTPRLARTWETKQSLFVHKTFMS
jgi:hypothetical protein